MNKTVTPKQLELTTEKSLANAPHIDPDSPVLAAAGRPKEIDYENFDWANDPAVILHEQRATAVYHNKFGGMVIQQERTWDEETDPYVVIGAENAVTFMEGPGQASAGVGRAWPANTKRRGRATFAFATT